MRRRSAQPGAVPAQSRARASHPAARWLQRGLRSPRRPGCTGRRLPRGARPRARGGTRGQAAARATGGLLPGAVAPAPAGGTPPGQTGGMGGTPETTAAGLLPVGRKAVDVAAELIRSRRPATVTAKGDRDQVTDVDLAIERTIRDL